MHKGVITSAIKGAAFYGKHAYRLGSFACKKRSRTKPLTLFTNRKDVIIMKKSTLIAWVAFFSAIAGALAAAYFYIQRREKELEEYEQLLFSEDFCDEAPLDELDDSFDELMEDEDVNV